MALTCPSAVMDWQLSKESVMDRLQVLLKTSQWSDCTFRVEGERDVQVFEAHRLLLASASPVFEAMCFGPLAEKACIIISDMEPVVFKILLEYVYTDVVRLSDCEEAAGVLYAAQKYMLPSLARAARDHLATHVRPSNALALFDFARDMQEHALQDTCVKVLCRQPAEALRGGCASGEALCALAQQEALNLPEEELWNAALLWATSDTRTQQGSEGERSEDPREGAGREGARAALDRCGLLPHLRFLALPPDAFHDALCSGVLRPHEALALERARRALAAGSAPENVTAFLPSGLCSALRPRATVPLAQFFCVRRFLKRAATVRGRMRLRATVRADRSVTVSGVRVFTRLAPPAADARARDPLALPAAPAPPTKYTEDLQVCVVEADGGVLSRTRFRDAVEYNTLATVPLAEAVRLRAGEEYGFLFELPAPAALPAAQLPDAPQSFDAAQPFEYPLGFMAQTERTRDIEFRFCDHADVGTGAFVRRLDMGYVDAIVYSI